MLDLGPAIERIKDLLTQGTEASVTYAALEARLALENVAYDRLRHRHDYISDAQIKKWQPGYIVTKLLTEVDDAAASSVTIRIMKPPVDQKNPDEADWIELGTQEGFNAKKLASMWQALARLALHIRLPETSSDPISEYGDKVRIAAKVSEVLQELERLSTGTIATSGLPKFGVTSFVCSCGETNVRRPEFLQQDQQVYCINPDCREVWNVMLEDGQHRFKRAGINVSCVHCGCNNQVPWRSAMELGRDQMLRFPCDKCGEDNMVWWHLAHGTMHLPTNGD